MSALLKTVLFSDFGSGKRKVFKRSIDKCTYVADQPLGCARMTCNITMVDNALDVPRGNKQTKKTSRQANKQVKIIIVRIKWFIVLLFLSTSHEKSGTLGWYFLHCSPLFCRQSVPGPSMLPTKKSRTLQGAHASVFLQHKHWEMWAVLLRWMSW